MISAQQILVDLVTFTSVRYILAALCTKPSRSSVLQGTSSLESSLPKVLLERIHSPGDVSGQLFKLLAFSLSRLSTAVIMLCVCDEVNQNRAVFYGVSFVPRWRSCRSWLASPMLPSVFQN